MKILGCLGFYSCYIKNLHLDSQPFHDLINDSTPFHWTEEHETFFSSIKERIHKDTVPAVLSTDYPFHFHLDSSNVGTGCIVIKQFPEGRKISRSTLEYLTKQSEKCPLFIENYAELYQLLRNMNIT